MVNLIRLSLCFVVVLTIAGTTPYATAQNTTSQVTSSNSLSSVTFGKRPATVGDALDQTIELKTSMKTITREEQEVLKEEQSETGRQQRRLVTASKLKEGHVVEATVKFVNSSESYQEKSVSDPVVGKTYRCVREGEDLQVFDMADEIPPIAEFKVVALAMESLGKPNPLAGFLFGKKVSVGQTISLPSKVAQQVFGLDKRMGVVDKFSMKLQAIESIDGRLVAKFNADVEAVGSGTTQMRLQLGGPLLIESATCRVVMTELKGPVGMLSTRGSLGHTYQVSGTGKLHLKISSRYLDRK